MAAVANNRPSITARLRGAVCWLISSVDCASVIRQHLPETQKRVPEKYVAGVAPGAKAAFSVSAFPNQFFTGIVSRIAHSVDVKTRTMPVELDVNNASRRLASGMFPEVLWPGHRPEATLFVHVSAVARTTEATFVLRIRERNVEWVNVRTGELDGKLIEVFGELHDGDKVAARGTDELRPGSHVSPKLVSTDPKSSAK